MCVVPLLSLYAYIDGMNKQDAPVAALKEENARLTGELRDAREKIRNLELQVEAVRANARKAAALLDG